MCHASDPLVSVILPRGIQRGAEHVLTFSGARLQDTEQVLFYEAGIEVVKIEPDEKNANIVRVTVKVAADCELGEKTAQVRTKTGLSDYRTFFVGALPAVEQKEPNTEFGQAQAIEQNVTVDGVVQNEDVDYFLVEAKKGQRLSVEVEGMRFGQTLFDPYIAILDQNRFELSAVDDSPLVRQDAVTSVIIPEDGKYTIEVRESGYAGNGNCRYRLHVGQFPRPVAVFPAGGRPGEEVEFTFIGDAAGEMKKKITLPADGRSEVQIFAEDDRGISPSGHTVRICSDPNSVEIEPNNALAEATPVEFPSAFNGILQAPGDHDYFKFAAKKGQTFEVECYGRRVRSAIDPVMHIFKVGGGTVAGNDDSRGPDSYIRFQVPEDGEYAVRIMDHLNQGGPDFTYRVEFQPVQPSLELGIPRVARYSQNLQRIYVARGNRFGSIISASRQNFGGELVLDNPQLPAGITMVAQPMPGNLNTMPVVFEATADAPLNGALVDFRAKLNEEGKNIAGGYKNRADFVIAGPGQSLYSWKDVDRLAFAVVDELPFSIEIVQPKVPIVRDGSMQLKIVAKKKEGWDEQINVQFPFRPPGIGANSSVNIEKGKTEALYPLSANGNAALGKWPVFAIGAANVNGQSWVSSQMATLEVAEPYIGIALQRTSVELGQQTELVAEVQVLKELKAPAQVQLIGLPHKVTAEALQISGDTKELVFKVKTEGDSPPGTHKNIFCQVIVTENEEPITHARVGNTELRVDKPLPKPVASPKKEEPKAAAAPAPAAPPAEKRLSRLEKLRLEAKQQGGGQ
ncbi:MAG: PPC domain-containing protein [Planctomycetaceae bacterium]|nr:PPC domain-containing protein [Planctomycetaceae bacterium]